MTREELFAELRRQGVAKVQVEFSGGGDEGGVDVILLLDSEGKIIRKLEEYYDKPHPDSDLSQSLAAPVYSRYGGFAGDFSVRGTVEWDVADGMVTMNDQEV